MIQFFRKLRQKLLVENRLGKYLLYATGEILLVMIGILLALQVKYWNEKRKLDHRDILLIRGWGDGVVSIDKYLLPLYRALQNEKSPNVKIVACHDNHGLSQSRKEIAKLILDWTHQVIK